MTFPTINHIDDVLPHIAGRNEFVVAERDGYTVIDYNFAIADSFDDPVRLECRGIKFAPDGRILARPLHKFFNVGERSDTQPHLLDFSQPHAITTKEDGCLHGAVRVEFVDGTLHSMREIVAKRLPGPVWGRSRDGAVVPTEIVGWSRLPRATGWKTIRVQDPKKHKGRNLSATDDHLIFTESGWVPAGSIRIGDKIEHKVSRFSQLQRSVVMGCLLGDMSIQMSGGARTLQWAHKLEHAAYNDLIASILLPFHTHRRIAVGGWGTERDAGCCCCAEPLDEICAATYTGKKVVTDEWLDALDEIAVAFWYMDDGSMSRGIPTQRPRAMFHTEGFDEKSVNRIVGFFRRWLGASPVIASYRGYQAIRLNADDAERLWDRIAQYIAPCMRYKLPGKFRNAPCFWDGFEPQTTVAASSVQLTVVGVDEGAGERRTASSVRYDIQTGTGNFFANTILVHNSMIHPAIVDGEVVFMTRMGRTDVARKAERHLTPLIRRSLRRYLDDGWTPIFEFTAPDNRIVVRYEQSALTLLAVRSMITGEYDDGHLRGAHAVTLLPIVDHHPSNWSTGRAFLDYARAVTGREGFVVRFASGLWVKAKGDDYVLKHKAKDSILQEKNVLAMVLGRQIDDVLPLLGVDRTADAVASIVEAGRDLDQKAFAVEHLAGVGAQLRSLAFAVRGGVDPRAAITSYLLKNTGSQTAVDAVRGLHGAAWVPLSGGMQ